MGVPDYVRASVRDLPVTADEDEFDPFAGKSLDPPPPDEGDDRVHEEGTDG
jgi:hypothetical protein